MGWYPQVKNLQYGHYSADSWMATYYGRRAILAEQRHFDRCVRDAYGYFAVQAGMPRLDFLRRCPIGCRVRVGLSPRCDVRASLAALPFESDSVDLLVSAHVLEFTDDPHGSLREAARVIRPEGRLSLALFNPHSLAGLLCLTDMTGEYPNHGHPISLAKLKDWLRLLDFSVERGGFALYIPPGTGKGSRRFLGWMELAGARWWPLFGALMFLQARKRTPSMSLIRPSWRAPRVRSDRLAIAGQDGR